LTKKLMDRLANVIAGNIENIKPQNKSEKTQLFCYFFGLHVVANKWV
jgi:hypothetical protein